MPYIGAHVSASGGLDQAAKRANAIGASAVQIFTGSPRIWKSKLASEYTVDKYFSVREQLGINKCVIHATYLINLASPNPELVAKSKAALVNDLKIAAKGEMVGVVVHLGSHQGRGFEVCKEQIAREIKSILDQAGDGVFLIENSAGQNGKIASQMSEIKYLLDSVDSNRLGWCVDTCHAHAAGYHLNTQYPMTNDQTSNKLFGEEKPARFLVEEIEKYNLWESLKCVHVNDSRDPFDSGRDRHENLGDGNIDKLGLKEFLNHSKLADLPFILEVPGIEGEGPDEENVKRLKALVGLG